MRVNALPNGYRLAAGKGNVEHNLEWILNVPGLDVGSYYWSVQAIDASYAGSSFSETSVYSTNTASNPENELLDIMIYPNPVDGNYVNIRSSIIGSKEIQVIDLNGRRILNTTVTNNQLDISRMSSGVYILRITINNRSKIFKLIVK